MDDLIITNHAADRFRERVKLPKRAVTKNARLALEKGISQAEATGQLRKYIDNLYRNEAQQANNIRIYCGMVYIFYFDTLLTLFPVPKPLQKQAVLLQRQKRDSFG